MSYLIIPMQIDALWLKQGYNSVGQDIAFQELPYYNEKKGVFMNSDKPYIAESIVSQAFQNTNLFLEEGVHLHWALPDLLTKGQVIQEETIFPAVPNRWYVAKTKNGQTEEWIIESDYLWDSEDSSCPIHALATVPLDIDLRNGKQPFAYMGRKYSLNEWITSDSNADFYWHKQKNEQHLTALGWGSLVFDTFYTHCRSIFGMHDKDVDVQNSSYTVIGWYDMEYNSYQKDVIKEILLSFENNPSYKQSTKEEQKVFFSDQLKATFQYLIPNGENPNWEAIQKLQKSLYYGQITIGEYKEPQLQSENINIAVGNNPAEAISALLIDDKKTASSFIDYLKEEEKLEAIMSFEDLNGLKLDVANRLREIRHEKGFVSVEGLWNWKIILENTQKDNFEPESETNTNQTPIVKLTNELEKKLQELRNTQYIYDVKYHKYKATLDALYMDWSRYMLSMYPPEGQTHDYPDSDTIRFYIQHHSLKKAETLKKELGVYPTISNRTTVINNQGLGATIMQLIDSINQELLSINATLQENYPQKKYILKKEQGTKFWEALPPALVLFASTKDKEASDLLRFSNRFINDQQKNIFLIHNDTQISLNKSTLNVDKVLKILKEQQPDFGKTNASVNDWHTFRIEWKVAVYPVATGHQVTRSSGTFDSDYIIQNYTLPEEATELEIKPSLKGLSLLSNASIYTGTSYITDSIKYGCLTKLTAFQDIFGEVNVSINDKKSVNKNVKDYITKLKNTQLLGISLTGFNAAMLQQKSVIRLKPNDPFGFQSHQQFAHEVAQILSGGEGNSPNPNATFNPIRCGALKIMEVRLIDTFGRTHHIKPNNIITATPNRIDQKDNWINLPPRLSQAATMSVRWLNSETSYKNEKNEDEKIKSPVNGWILPVYINQRIEFFNALGKHLGAITHKGEWENSVFDHAIAKANDLSFVSNKQLRKVIEWIIDKIKQKSFHEAFITLFQATANSVQPEHINDISLFEIIATTPIAITQISVNLYVKGEAAFDLDWNVLRTELDYNKVERHAKDFTKIKFPYIIGDFHQYNDGVIAYWQNEKENLGDNIYFNNAIRALLKLKNEDESKFSSELQTESEYRYDNTKTFIDFLKELAKKKLLCKHEFTKYYIKNGSKFWDLLITEGFIKLVKSEHANIKRTFDNENLNGTIADENQIFTILMHPKGVLHISTGILPVKRLRLPERSYQDAMQTIELSFLVSPLITPSKELAITLYQDKRYEWSWLEANKAKKEKISNDNPPEFTRTLQRSHLQKAQFLKIWETHYKQQLEQGTIPTAIEVWKLLQEYQFIETAQSYQKEDFAFFKQDEWTKIQQEYSQINKTEDNLMLQKIAIIHLLNPILPMVINEIYPFYTQALAVPPIGITEGWLSIKSNITKI